jgi:pimeloyl-ACP methyl ester carboxylesterase
MIVRMRLADVCQFRSQPTNPNSIPPRRERTGLNMHFLAAGEPGAPLVLLLHGFPELALSWRKMMPLADAGFYFVAPDQRGYGQATGWDDRFDGDLRSFSISGIATDALALVRALDVTSVHAVIGHDFGSPIATRCGLTRPDVFRACIMMSAPYRAPPPVGSSRLEGDGPCGSCRRIGRSWGRARGLYSPAPSLTSVTNRKCSDASGSEAMVSEMLIWRKGDQKTPDLSAQPAKWRTAQPVGLGGGHPPSMSFNMTSHTRFLTISEIPIRTTLSVAQVQRNL